MSPFEPGWRPDPAGRYEQRYWDGNGWTDHVASRGVMSLDPHTRPPPRRRTRFLLGLLVVAAIAGMVVFLTRSGNDDRLREEYVDAIAETIESDDDLFVPSDDERRCIAEAEVDVIGLSALEDHATPAEIRDNPDSSPADFGIQPTHQQGLEMADAVQRCITDLGAAFAAGITAEGLPVDDPDAAGDCLAAGFDTPPVRDLYAADFQAGGDVDPTEEQANAMYDWLFSCIDARAAMLPEIAEDVDAETAECIAAGITDEWLRRAMVNELTGGGEGVNEDLRAEITPVITGCMVDSSG